MEFAEELPDKCPPRSAQSVDLANVFRLTSERVPTANSFRSHAALGKRLPKGLTDACAWASCSLTTEPAMLKKLKRLRYPYAARLALPASAGVSRRNGTHIDFWCSKGFALESAVEAVEVI